MQTTSKETKARGTSVRAAARLSEMIRELERQDAEWIAIHNRITGVDGVPPDAEVLVKADFLDELRDLAAAPTRPEGTKGVLA